MASEADKRFDAAFEQAAQQLGLSLEPSTGMDDDGTRDASEPTKEQVRSATQPAPAATAADEEEEPDDVVAARLQKNLAEEEARREANRTSEDSRMLERVKKFGPFLDDIDRNPALRAHIQAFWDSGRPARPAEPDEQPEDDDPFAAFDDESRAAVAKALKKQEERFSGLLDKALAPFRDQMARQEAQSELSALNEQFPDWKDHASFEDLAAIRQQFPQLNVLAAYKLAAFDRVRARVGNAGRQLATVRDVLNRPKPGESTPRRAVRVQPKKAVSFEEAFDRAYGAMNAAGMTPPRR